MTPEQLAALREIPLSNGETCKVDAADYENLKTHKWFVNVHGYAVRNCQEGECRKQRLMHRDILFLDTNDGKIADHINGDKLDNRRINLRICTRQQNNQNVSLRSNNKSGYKGVHWDKRRRKWTSQIKVNSIPHHIGYYDTAEKAHAAYCEAAKKFHGDFANIGKPPAIRALALPAAHNEEES